VVEPQAKTELLIIAGPSGLAVAARRNTIHIEHLSVYHEHACGAGLWTVLWFYEFSAPVGAFDLQ